VGRVVDHTGTAGKPPYRCRPSRWYTITNRRTTVGTSAVVRRSAVGQPAVDVYLHLSINDARVHRWPENARSDLYPPGRRFSLFRGTKGMKIRGIDPLPQNHYNIYKFITTVLEI